MSPLSFRTLFLASILAIPTSLQAQETLELNEASLPEGVSISLTINDDAPSDSVEDRLDRLERNLERQQGLLEQVVERLESSASIPTDLAVPAVPATPVPPVPVHMDGFDEDGGQDIASFGGPVHVAVGMAVDEAVAFGASVTVEGTVEGDAVSFGEDVIIASTGVVNGDAVSFGGRVRVEEGGRVEGDRVALATDEAPTGASGLAMLAQKGGTWMHGMVRRTVLLLCLAGIGVLLLGLFPDKVRNTALGLERHPIRYGLAGLLLSGTGFAVAGLLAITIIGLPISAFVLLLLGLAWLLGFVALGQAIGDLLPVPSTFRGKVGAFLVGVFLLGALSFVPYLGKLLIFFSFFPCVGAAVGTRFGASSS